MYKVSLIIPCYNITQISSEDNKPFEAMINSVINQSIGIENIEVLLVDDCSTDSTKSRLHQLNNKYPNIKPIFLEKNSGHPSIPRNVGIKNSSSNYIMFLDQDDKMDLRCIEKLYDEITNNNVDFVKANYSIQMGKRKLNYDTGRNERLVITPRSSDMIYLVSHFMWSSIYNKQFLLNNNIFFPDSQAEDNLFLSKCFNCTEKNIIALNDYFGVIYTANNNNSLAHSFTLKQVKDYVYIFQLTLDSYIKYNQNSSFIEINFKRYIIILLGSLLRSTVTYDKRKIMVKLVNDFQKKYEYHVNIALHWKLCMFLIKHNLYLTLHIVSKIINKIFDNKLFIKLFRNDNYV